MSDGTIKLYWIVLQSLETGEITRTPSLFREYDGPYFMYPPSHKGLHHFPKEHEKIICVELPFNFVEEKIKP